MEILNSDDVGETLSWLEFKTFMDEAMVKQKNLVEFLNKFQQSWR